MSELVNLFGEALAGFSPLNQALLALNLILLLFSRRIIARFAGDDDEGGSSGNRLWLFRATNLLLLLLILFYNIFLPLSAHSMITRILSALLVAYLGYLGFYLANYFIKRRFGRVREVSGNTRVAETYNSRVLSLISAIFMFIVVLISVVQIFGFDGLLEAGGVIGFVGVFLALTQSSWAPDIISGLIILNSKLVEEGDVIEFSDGSKVRGIVFKTKVFHTEILNLVNNHRVMLQNSRLRQQTIHNLSKFASARGLREVLKFKIGYNVPENKVRTLFETAHELAKQDADIDVEEHSPIEVRAIDAGDYAIEWSLFYYTKDVKHLPRTRELLLALVLQQAEAANISLATPVLTESIITQHSERKGAADRAQAIRETPSGPSQSGENSRNADNSA